MSLAELERHREDINKCFRCNLCKIVPLPLIRDVDFVSACPISSHYHHHAWSGSGLQFLAHSLIDGRLEASADMAEVAFACRVCGYCDVACKSIMDAERSGVIQALREHLVDAGFAPASNRAALENMRQYGHATGVAGTRVADWARVQGIKVLPEQQAPVLLLAGDELHTDPAAFAVLQKLAALLERAGIDFGVLADEPASGIHAWWAAGREMFSQAAQAMASEIAACGARTVVTASGTALGMLRAKYADYGVSLPNIEVRHASELLAELLRRGKLRPQQASRPLRVTYHDPCFLGRHAEPTEQWDGEVRVAFGQLRYEEPPKAVRYGTRGVYDAPREVLQSLPGVELVEMPRIREYALCCGYGGGGLPEYAELVDASGRERLREAASVAPDVLATACGFCAHHFRATQAGVDAPGRDLRVADLVDLVHAAVFPS
jgi:Fe-S oxidoreductase